MVYFDQHIVLTPETQVYIGVLVLVLLLLALALLFVGLKNHQLIMVVQTQSKMWIAGDGVQARKVERKNE